jgi:hypothetical protein
MKLEFSRHILKNAETSISKKIRWVGAEFFHVDGRTYGRADRQTDVTKLIVALRNFANAPETLNTMQCTQPPPPPVSDLYTRSCLNLFGLVIWTVVRFTAARCERLIQGGLFPAWRKAAAGRSVFLRRLPSKGRNKYRWRKMKYRTDNDIQKV